MIENQSGPKIGLQNVPKVELKSRNREGTPLTWEDVKMGGGKWLAGDVGKKDGRKRWTREKWVSGKKDLNTKTERKRRNI